LVHESESGTDFSPGLTNWLLHGERLWPAKFEHPIQEESNFLLHQVPDKLEAEAFDILARTLAEALEEGCDGDGFHNQKPRHTKGQGADNVESTAQDALVHNDSNELRVAESRPDAQEHEESTREV